MDLPSFITDSKFTLDIKLSSDKDYRDLCPNIAEIQSWKNYPDPKYEVVEDGKVVVKRNKKSDFNALARYILFFYDKKSPFQKRFNSVDARKANAITLSGVDEKLIEHEEAIDMIVDFLVYQDSKLWAVIMTNENLFIEYMSVLNTKWEKFNSDKDVVETLTKKEKVRGFLEALSNDLERQYDKFYSGDKELMEEVQKKRKLTPETISKRLSR